MKIRSYLIFGALGVWASWLQQVHAAEAKPPPLETKAVLAKNLRQLVTDKVFASKLLEQARIQPQMAVSAGDKQGRTTVVCVIKLSKSFGRGERKEFVRPFLANELLKHRVLSSPAFKKEISQYKYNNLLRDSLGRFLLESLTGKVKGLGLGTAYIHDDEYTTALSSVPHANVEVKVVEYIKKERTAEIYRVALVRETSAMLSQAKYTEAKKLLFEANKFGYKGSRFFSDLYHVFLFTGEAKDVSKIADRYIREFEYDLTEEDCTRLSQLSKAAKNIQQSEFWLVQAKKRAPVKGLSLDDLVPDNRRELPPAASPQISDLVRGFKPDKLHFRKEYNLFFQSRVDLLDLDNAATFELNGRKYLIATGSTITKETVTPEEIMRRKIVAYSKAKRAAVEYLNGMKISFKSTSEEVIVRTITGDKTTVKVFKSMDRQIHTTIKGRLGGFKPIAEWTSKDGDSHFRALVIEIK